MDNDSSTDNLMNIRAKLRSDFLKKVMTLHGKECNIEMYENTTVSGIYQGADVEFQEILVDNLVTPTCVVPHTIIRANDTIAIEFLEKEKK